MRLDRRLIAALFVLIVPATIYAAEPRRTFAAATVSTPQAKIEAGLLLALRDSTFRERINRQYKTAAPSEEQQFAIERAEDGSLAVPIFIETSDVEAAKHSIAAAHGTLS